MFSYTIYIDLLPSFIQYCGCSLVTRQQALLIYHFLTCLPMWDVRDGINFYQCDRQKMISHYFCLFSFNCKQGNLFCLQVTFVFFLFVNCSFSLCSLSTELFVYFPYLQEYLMLSGYLYAIIFSPSLLCVLIIYGVFCWEA